MNNSPTNLKDKSKFLPNKNPTKPSKNPEMDMFKFENKIRFIIDSLMVPLHVVIDSMKESNDEMKLNVSKIES